MEDAATAEISRSQLWQWLNTESHTDSKITINKEYIDELMSDEVTKIKDFQEDPKRLDEAVSLFRDLIFDQNFDWYYNNGITGDNKPPGSYQFTHGFVVNDSIKDSTNFPMVASIANSLECNKLLRIKANLNPRTIFNKSGGWHVDVEGYPQIKNTAVYYLNTCNGYTKFKKGGKVKSVANRIVIFDSQLYHQGYTCTDQKRRVVMNFNWI